MNLLNNVFHSRQVVTEMLETRGYDVEKYKNYSLDEVDIMLKNMAKKVNSEMCPLDLICSNKKNTETKIYVKYLLQSKIRLVNLKNIIEDMIENLVENNSEIIFIIKDKISNMVSYDNMFDSYVTVDNIHIQIFSIENLLVNITKHVLVPPLRILSDEEKDTIVETYRLNKLTQLPIILKSDPVAKFYGVRKGDLCEIVRPSETSGIYINYRYCE